MDLHLHIVSLNVPYPADYGGVIDIMGRIIELHKQGVKIHLHCFLYNRPPAVQLEEYCEEVLYYKRNTSCLSQFSMRPYIVQSRHSQSLVSRLKRDNYPIWLEGLHCCDVLELISNRHIFVRMHNVEHDYYDGLARVERKIWKRLFFRMEAFRLKKYEHVLPKATAVFAITQNDASHFRSIGCDNVICLPSFHPDSMRPFHEGLGDYVLYHGNLSVPENIHAAEYIIKNVAPFVKHTVIIAGSNPDKRLLALTDTCGNVQVRSNLSDEEMSSLVAQSQINLLYTEQATGIKLKLIKSLKQGRHCVVNSTMVEGTQLGAFCHIADTAASMVDTINRLMNEPFSENDYLRRRIFFEHHNDSKQLVEKLSALLNCNDTVQVSS